MLENRHLRNSIDFSGLDQDPEVAVKMPVPVLAKKTIRIQNSNTA
jgi:hypothetical protein